MQYVACYSRCIAIHFQQLQLVHLIDRWSNFYLTRMNRLMRQHLLSSAVNKKERETWKVQCGSTQWKVDHIVYEKSMRNYNMSLLIPEYTGTCDNTTRRHLKILACLRFDIAKNNIHVTLFEDLFQQSHGYNFVLDHLDQYALTYDQLIT